MTFSDPKQKVRPRIRKKPEKVNPDFLIKVFFISGLMQTSENIANSLSPHSKPLNLLDKSFFLRRKPPKGQVYAYNRVHYSSNNVPGDALEKNECDFEYIEEQKPSKLTVLTGYRQAGFQDIDIIGDFENLNGWTPAQKRDILNSQLSQYSPGEKFFSYYWDKIAIYNKMCLKSHYVENTSFDTFKEYNFSRCNNVTSKGTVYVKKSDPYEILPVKMSCGEKVCLECNNKKRKYLGYEHARDWIQIINAHEQDFRGSLHIVATLPESIEGLPLQDVEIEKKLVKGLQNIVRKIFGRKSRSNIAINCAVHPVGDNDLFRDRWHIHFDILPFEIVGDQFFWLQPDTSKTTKDHHFKSWKIDLGWLRDCWTKVIRDTTGYKGAVANPQIDFIPFNPSKKDKFFKKIVHRLKYDLRSFANDLTSRIRRVSEDGETFILSAKRGIYNGFGDRVYYDFWLDVPFHTLIQRFLWIRSHNKVRARGAFQNKKRYRDILGLIPEEAVDLDDYNSCSADVAIHREMVFNPDTNKIEFEHDYYFEYQCPVLGKRAIWKSKIKTGEYENPYNDINSDLRKRGKRRGIP